MEPLLFQILACSSWYVRMVSSGSSASWKLVGRPFRSKAKRLMLPGVGVKASGYCFGSRSYRSRGGLMRSVLG